MSHFGAARQTCVAHSVPMPTDVSPPALSLQDKLNRIAHEREVLALARELARHGLRDGDRVVGTDGAGVGQLMISRDEKPPRLLVLADDGTRASYSPALWRRA